MTISQSEVDAIGRVLDSPINDTGRMVIDPADHDPEANNEAHFVSERLCESITSYATDNTIRVAAEHFGLGRATVFYHYSGRCSHTHGHIDPTRCAVAREMARDGWSNRDLADYFDVHHSTAGYHVSGDCSCDHDVPVPEPNSQQVITPRVCERMQSLRDEKSRSELMEYAGVSSSSTLHKHLSGDCDCQ